MNTLITYSLLTPVGFLIKATLLLLTAWVACQLLQRASAATRHLVCVAALVSVLLVPILSLTLPQWKIAWGHVSASATIDPIAAPQAPPLPLAPTDAPAISQVAPPSPLASDESESLPAVAPISRALPVPTSGHHLSAFTCALGISLLIWLIGLLAVLCQFFVGLNRLTRIERHSIPLEHTELQIAEDVRGRMGLRRPVRFLRATEASTVVVPVTWGVLRPVVLLPAQSNAWSEDCLRAALLHELAHISRWDWPTQLMARFAYALYWWHPLVWWAARRAREESERACDDLVLGTGMKAADYAQRLIEVVRSMPEGTRTKTVAIAMAQPSEVEGRLQAVLAKGRNRMSVHQNGLVAGIAIGIVALLPLSALRIAAQTRQNDNAAALVTGDVVPTGALVTRNTRWVLSACYLSDVACPRFPDRPITVVTTTDLAGVKHYVFHDKRTGHSSRDSSLIEADLNHLLAEGTQPRLGATVYSMPNALASMKHLNGQTVSFTRDQRAKADLLESEIQRWAGRESALIISDGDVEPSASAAQREGNTRVNLQLLPEGQKKLTDFQQAHVGEYLGIWVVDSILPRIATLVGPVNGGGLTLNGLSVTEAQSLVQAINTPDGTEVIGGGIRRASYPNGTIYEADEDMNHQVPVASGFSTRLPNRCVVEVNEVSQLRNKGGKWVTGGLRWTPTGASLPARSLGENSKFALTVNETQGLVPHNIRLKITVPNDLAVTQPVSTYLQLEGTANVPWAYTFWRWGDHVGPFFPQDGKPCTLRVGVASGPWQTAATLPFHLSQQELPKASADSPWPLELKLDDRPALMYKDKNNQPHTEYFLPAGQRLGNVARRLVAVDTSGRTVVSSDFNSVPRLVPAIGPPRGIASNTYPVGVGIFGICFYGPLLSDVASIKEFRLETRPYQVVEFRNVRLQPAAETRSAQPSDTALLTQAIDPATIPFKGHPIVVVDAGHGGIDTGGIGLNGVKEKDLNLLIAQQLHTELERRGAVVYMTRSDDAFPSLLDRPRLATARHADYFISVHCDLRSAAPPSTHADGQGTQVFFHGSDAKCERLAEDISQQIGQSSALSPNRVLSDTTRFVEGFGVLRGASMPAVLVECGYLDNAHDLSRLRDPQGQQQIADGIAQGLIRFQSQD